MPLKGYVCPPTAPTAGDRNEPEHCLGKCPHPCVSPPLLAAIYRAEKMNHHVGTYVSASMLSGGGCRKQTYLERNFDFYESPRRRFWPFRGTLSHRIVEDAAGMVEPYGWIQELRMSVPLEYPEEPRPILDEEGKFTGEFHDTGHLILEMGGTTDAYNPFALQLHDYKTMADKKADMFIYGSKGGTFSPHFDDSWVWQLNTYRWLISRTPITKAWKSKFKKQGLEPPKGKFFPAPEELRIQGISMMEIPITGGGYKPLRGNSSAIDAIPVLPLEEIEEFVVKGALEWYRHLVLGEVPPVLPKNERWKCKSCPFNGELIPGEPCFPNAE